MYLKSIEVQGFKSFANRLKFEFNDGITGIVGPNGSGKSNIADAVRWVLGEQRVKQLRGGNMQDVIFSGTENRKPLSYASVSITLDNADHALQTDFEEVTVTRRLYRSGESDYLLNGRSCRLRDINELFYDTGIGKEGYSIIGQGQIEKILSDKPEDRRELFDEAAGIVKFKRRKSMTEKKLEEEHDNLTRVTDILSEIERRLGPLEKQSAVAKEYLKKKEELKSYDINMFLLEYDRLREQLSELEGLIGNVERELQENREAYESSKEEYEKIEEDMDLADKELQEARNQLNQTNMLKNSLENQVELLKEKIKSIHASDEHYGRRAMAITSEIEKRESETRDLASRRSELAHSLQECGNKLRESEAALHQAAMEIDDLEAEIEADKRAIIQALNERASTRARLQRFTTLSEQNAQRKSEIYGKLLSIKGNMEEQEEVILKCQEDDGILLDDIGKATAMIGDQEKLVKVIQGELAALGEKVNSTRNTYHRENSRLESLKNMTERYDGYGNSIRKVMEKKGTVNGLEGVVADIIQTDKKYELAVETALGGAIQNIVVDCEETAKKMIEFLKINRYGRCTFLPLSSVRKSGFKDVSALKEPGVIGLASDLVRVEEKYRDVVSHLLGRTLVVDQIDHAITVSRKYRHSLRIVTLEGESFLPGGSMTGGAFKNTSNLLSRRREIDELENMVIRLHRDMDEAFRMAEEKKAAKGECYDRIDEIGKDLHRLQLLHNTNEMKIQSCNKIIEDSRKRYKSLEDELRTLENELKEISMSRTAIEEELASSGIFEEETNASIEVKTDQLDEAQEVLTEYQKSHEEIRLKNLELTQKDKFLGENIERIAGELKTFQEELDALMADKTDAVQEIQSKEEEIAAIRKRISDSQELFAELEDVIRDTTDKKEKLNKRHRQFLEKREHLNQHIAELDKEQFRLASRKESYDQSLQEQIDYMWNEYELTYNRALALRNEELTNLALIKKQIYSIKSEMKAMGSVNVNAIEEYKEQLERFTFLNGQKEDLVEAENSLLLVIKELEEGMRKQFREQFARVNTEFNNVFRKLFGGGTGRLELVTEEDILEAGIRIIAQPPGKKLQNMMQMSGGEKSLTAIALLFAIQGLKPSPFCLLDEIEAALDDANVKRFADYLHQLTENTQFIVITHRRGTMTVADRLYGITMQEKGISTLVSVDLLEDKLDA